MIVRWGLGELPAALDELGIERPFVVASKRWSNLDLPADRRWSEVPTDRIANVSRRAEGSDGLVVVGGGSAIDLAKAISAETGLPLVSVPTTYSGAEWTAFFGVRDRERRMRGGGSGARLAAIVYEPELTLSLGREETVGTAMNALAHCAEALYARGRDPTADKMALAAAGAIAEQLPRVVERPDDVEARTALLRGAALGGEALARSGLALGHAIAQALGGRYGLPHGAMNALALPPALRFNADFVPPQLGQALGGDPAAQAEELARLGGFQPLRDFGVPKEELGEVAEAAAARPGALANPRPASPAEVEELLAAIW
ncbi:MAG: iron-containing alcohol dehydrogenase [Gaiellaceae bacterium]